MESLLDEVDSLLAPGLSTDPPDWCSNCQSLKQEIKRLQDEQLQNITKLKQKIISTDLLIKKYKSKCDDYDVQCKKTEEANKRADKSQTQCEILQTQVKAALLDTEPLRETKIRLEAEVRLKDKEIQSLSDRLLAVESARQQYEYLSKTSSMDIEKLEAEKKELMQKMKSHQAGKLTKEAAKEYRSEIAGLKRDKATLLKNEKRLESKLAAANTRIEKLTNMIKDRKLSPKRRIRTVSGNLSSPLKSPTRSPRSLSHRDHKQSPLGQGRSQSLVERKSETQTTGVVAAQVNEKLASESSNTSDDTDDDNMSVCSVKWPFSPLMKCLSPLPPSPACFAERKMERGDSEEGEVSDIADILEQQLLEEDTTCQMQHDGITEETNENVTDVNDDNSRKCIKEMVKEDSASSVNCPKEPGDNKETVDDTSKVDIVAKELTNCGNIKDTITEQLPVVENRDEKQTLKEKLAKSINIISPTAVRKRVAHQPNSVSNHHETVNSVKTTTNLKYASSCLKTMSDTKDTVHDTDIKSVRILNKPPVRRSARINSQKENETDEQVNDSVEEMVENSDNRTCKSEVKPSAVDTVKSVKPELNQIESKECTPIVPESLTNCDVDITTKNISKEVSELVDNNITVDDMRLSKDTTHDNSSSQDMKDSIRINEAKNVNKTNCESITSSPRKINTCGNDVKIGKQTMETKSVTLPKSCLQKVETPERSVKETSPCIESKNAGVEINGNCSKKGTKKFGSDKFINFQQSSSRTLSNEIDDYSFVGDYEVLDRNNKNTIMSPKIGRMQKKNVTRRLRRTCRYRDLDSEIKKESKEVVNNFSDEQQGLKTKVIELKDKSVIDKTVRVEKREGEHEVHVDKTVTCKSETVSKELSLEVLRDIDGNKETEGSKCSIKQNVTCGAETRNDNKTSENIKESECEECNNNAEKFITNRQMSTGFTVNTPTFERASSTESAASFGTSPSRLFTFESTSCGTIVEEESEENFKKDGNESKCNSKMNSDSNFIFGVEDLLNFKQEPLPVSQNSDNAQNENSTCDNNPNTNALTVGRTINSHTSSSLHTVGQDDEYIKPGCSYQYDESSVQLPRQEVSNDTAGEINTARVPSVSETLLHDDSSSRSSIQSITSIDRASPVSPLSLSPFDFLNPISPLPPSPIRNIDRVSPLSPEHITGEQKAEFGDNEPDLADNNKTDSIELDENVKVENVTEDFSGKTIHSPALSVSENVKSNDVVIKEENSRNKVPVLGSSNKIKSNKKLESAKKVEDSSESVKNVQKPPPGTPEIEKYSSDASLNIFQLPQMISPVKTPNRSAKVKTEQIKSSRDITKLISQKDQVETSASILGDGVDKCTGEPKQFVTKAPVTAITVKPKLTRGRTLVDKTNTEMCIRKSRQTALKRVSPLGKLDSSKAKAVVGDITQGEESLTCKTSLDITSLKSESLTNAEQVKESDTVTKKFPDNNSDIVKVEDKVDAVVSIDEKGDNKVIGDYTLGQDNLAFKRKARVAHKPNTNHPVKLQKKIQIIDAPVLPHATVSRKRKSLDNNKEHCDKKKPKERLLKTQKSSSSEKIISQETKKKMQAFLKSSETAECFVAKFSSQPCDDTVSSDLLAACLECLGRVQTDTLDVVYRMCESGQYSNIDCQLPFISDVEKKAVELIQYICTELKCDKMGVMKKIWDCVLSRDTSANIVGKMAQCRVYVALCSLEGDVEQARALFYHIVTCGHLNYTQFIVSVVSVWPEVLKKDPTDTPDKVVSHGMTLVLEEVVTKLLQSPSEVNNKILVILQTLCGWSGKTGNADSILKLLCNRMLSILESSESDKSGILELTLALELLCSSQTWPWFKEQFIMRTGLQTACNKYLAQRILKPVPPEYMCEMLKQTSRGLYTYSSVVKGREYQQVIKNWLLPVLKHKQGSLTVQESCVETMIELSPLYPDILNIIHSWFTENNDICKELTTRLEYLRLQYKQKTGLVCKPFVKT